LQLEEGGEEEEKEEEERGRLRPRQAQLKGWGK